MASYESLAASYDELTYDIDYAGMLDFLEQLLHHAHRSARSVLDLACGTGSLLTCLLDRGYDAIGADLSEDMLAVASEKLAEREHMPLLLCCPMQELRLPDKVDWIVCCLDSLNYVTDPKDCQKALQRTYENLKPGGTLIFDINTPCKLRGLDGQIFLDETDDTYCVWRAEFSEEERSVFYGMDIFQREGETWLRRRCIRNMPMRRRS